MSVSLQQALEDYLMIRRQLGYQLQSSGRLLAGFVRFAEQAGARTITTELAVAWARQPQVSRRSAGVSGSGWSAGSPATSRQSTRTPRSHPPMCCLLVSNASRRISTRLRRSRR